VIDKANWSATGTEIKGDAYEVLLSQGASGSGLWAWMLGPSTF
jgi:type I restriction enzyme M protein